jgi:LPS-assembly protein
MSGVVVSRPSMRTADLFLDAERLSYDPRGTGVVVRGNVEIRCADQIVTAEEVVFDAHANILTASGNIRIIDPLGNIIGADRFTFDDGFRDAFLRSLKMAIEDGAPVKGTSAPDGR